MTGERARKEPPFDADGAMGRGAVVCSLTSATFATNSLIALTETADTTLPAWPPTPTPASWPVHRQWRGRAIELEGRRLKEVAGRLQRDVFDVEVEVAFQRRVYAGIRRTIRRRVRLVAVRLPESSEYRFYLTNIDPDSLDAQAIAQTYAARWQIELIFKELKSHYRLDELPTSKAHIVETLLLGAVITLLVSRRLLQAVRERLRRTAYKMPEQRWAALFAGARNGDPRHRCVASARVFEGHCPTPRIDAAPRGARPESVAPTPHRARRNPAPRGHNSMYFNPLTDHQCGFVLVSSDSDFARLASRLREQGLQVFGIGKRNTPEAFRKACKRFIFVENLLGDGEPLRDADGAAQSEPVGDAPGARELVTRIKPSTPAQQTPPATLDKTEAVEMAQEQPPTKEVPLIRAAMRSHNTTHRETRSASAAEPIQPGIAVKWCRNRRQGSRNSPGGRQRVRRRG